MMNDFICKLYLFFSSHNVKLEDRITVLQERFLYCADTMSVDDINELVKLRCQLDYSLQLQQSLFEYLNSLKN